MTQTKLPCAQWPGLYFLGFVFSIFILFNPGKLSIDDYLRLVEAVMVLDHGRLDLDPQYLPETGYAYYQSADGRLFVYWGFISSMLYLPAALVGKICKFVFPLLGEVEASSGRSLLVERFIGSMVVMPSIMLVNVMLFWRLLQRYFSVTDQRTIGILTIMAFLGTQLLKYSSGFEEGFMILLFLAAFILYEECQEPWKKGLCVGTLTGIALNARYYVGLPVLFLFVLWQGLQGKGFLRFLAVFAISLFPYAILFGLYNYVRCGSFSPEGFFQYYSMHFSGPKGMMRSSASEVLQFLKDRTIGEKGLLVFNPILILAPFGIIAAFKNRCHNSPETHLLLYSCGVVSCYLGVHAVLTMGSFDLGSWGPRYLTASVPFLFLIATPAILNTVCSRALKANRIIQFGLAILVCMSFVIQLLGVLGWDETEIHQGSSASPIAQRAHNIWKLSTHGNPFVPHQNAERPLFSEKKIFEITKDSLSNAVGFDVKTLYEGFSLWPVTLGYALGWGTWKVLVLILANLAVTVFLGMRWVQHSAIGVDHGIETG